MIVYDPPMTTSWSWAGGVNSQLVRITSALNSTTFLSDMKFIKVIFAFPLCWMLWAFGDFAYSVLELFDEHEHWCAFWYPVYNALMYCSSSVQAWAVGSGDHWPWSDLEVK